MRTLLPGVLFLLLVGSVAQAQDSASRASRGTRSATPGTPDVIIPGTPGTPAIGDLPGTPGTPPLASRTHPAIGSPAADPHGGCGGTPNASGSPLSSSTA